MTAQARWFGRAMWLGILADWTLAVPTMFAPEAVLGFFSLRPTADPVWTAFAAQLVFLISLFYVPAAIDPHRYRFNAWTSVVSRMAVAIFFLLLSPGLYPAIGLLAGLLFVLQLPLLLLAMRDAPPAVAIEPAALQAPATDRSALWLKRTLWLGIIADWVLGTPGIFLPDQLLSTLRAAPTADPVWTAFAALSLVLLGVIYVPGANQPYRYRANAWLAVIARVQGVIFFLLLWSGPYPQFGLLDGSFFLMQFPFLLKTMQLIRNGEATTRT